MKCRRMPSRWTRRAACRASQPPIGGDHQHHPAVAPGPLAPHEALVLHAVDHPGEPALAGQDAARDLVHRHALGLLLQLHHHVVPAEGELAGGLELGVEDVRQGQGALEEDPPGGERLRAGA